MIDSMMHKKHITRWFSKIYHSKYEQEPQANSGSAVYKPDTLTTKLNNIYKVIDYSVFIIKFYNALGMYL